MRFRGEGTYGYDEAKKLFWWRLRIDGKSIVRKAKTKEALKTAVLKVQNELEEHGRIAGTDDRSKLAVTWFREWLKVYAKPAVRSSTYRFYEQMIRLYICPPLEAAGTKKAKKLKELKTTDCQLIINEVRYGENTGPTTAGHVRSVMIRALKKAVALGLIRQNPALETSKIPKAESTRRSLPPEAVQLVLDEAMREYELKTRPGEYALVHADGPLIAYLLVCGVRIGESLGNMIVDINFRAKPRPTIRVERNLDRDGGWWDLTPAKSKTKRTLPLSQIGEAIIRRQLVTIEQDKKRAGVDYLDNGFLFAAATGAPLEESHAQGVLTSILGAIDRGEADSAKKLGHYSLHELRHTFGSMLARQGVPLHILQKLMGHEDSTTTAKYYLHTFGDDLAAAMLLQDRDTTEYNEPWQKNIALPH
jgi:integrase